MPVVKHALIGPQFSKIDVPALEQLISELNDCELYARVHKQVSSLDRYSILDVADRLQFYIKNRYADFLLNHCGNPNDPSFETFKNLLNRELHRSNTTFIQSFRYLHEKGKKTKHLKRFGFDKQM